MATIAVSISGSAIVNGSKNYTISDADLQAVLDWAKAQYGLAGQTNAQVLLAWVQQTFINATQAGVQTHQTTVSVPPPISIS